MPGKLNIWILSSQIPPVVGGIARYCSNAADMFAGGGHEVTLIAPADSAATTRLPNGVRQVLFVAQRARQALAHIPAPTTSSARLSYWPALSLDMADQVFALAEREGTLPDIVECQEYGGLAYFYLQRRLTESHALSKVPLVVTLHSPHYAIQRANGEAEFRLPSYWVGCMERFVLCGADRLLASSQFLRSMVQQDLPHLDTTIDVIPLPYRPFEQSPGEPVPGELLYYGRLQVLKGVVPLVEACERLWRTGQQFRLTLIGLDTLFVREQMSVAQYLNKRFNHWITRGNLTIIADAPLPDQELWQRIRTAWAVVIPSTWENFPNTCIESMALGKLVIVSKAGGQAEIVGSAENGIVFDWDEAGSCEAAVELALSLERADLEAIGTRARRRVQQLTSFEQVLPQRIRQFEHVIAHTSATRRFPSTSPGMQGCTCERDAITGSEVVALDITAITEGVAFRAAVEQIASGFVLLYDAANQATKGDLRRALDLLGRYPNLSYVGIGSGYDSIPACHVDFPIQLAYNLIRLPVLVRRSDLLEHGCDPRTPWHADPRHLLADVWLQFAEHGCLGTSVPSENAQLAQVQDEWAADQELYFADTLAARHPELYKQYGAELFALQNANGAALRWNHPAAEQIDFRVRYFELLGAHQRLLGFLRPAAPAVKALRRLKRRFGRPS